MMPVLASFDVGGTSVTVAAYGTFLVLAATAALALGAWAAAGLSVRLARAVTGVAVAVLAGLVGARLLDAVLNWPYYGADPARILDLRFRGFALYGGLIGGALGIALVARAWRIPFARLADRAIPAVVVGIVMLRIGCFLNGCCAGVETTLPWGVTFPPRVGALGAQALNGLGSLGIGVVDEASAVHPTQLYEVAAVLVCGAAAALIARRGARSGVPALAFAAGFLLFRAADQTLRVPSPDTSVPDWWITAAYAVAGLAAAAILARRRRAEGAEGRRGHVVVAASSPSTGGLGAAS